MDENVCQQMIHVYENVIMTTYVISTKAVIVQTVMESKTHVDQG